MLLVVLGFGCAEPAFEPNSTAVGSVPLAVAVVGVVTSIAAGHGRLAGNVDVSRLTRETAPVRAPTAPAPAPGSRHAPCSCTHAVGLTTPPTLAASVVATTATHPARSDRSILPNPTLPRQFRPPVTTAG